VIARIWTGGRSIDRYPHLIGVHNALSVHEFVVIVGVESAGGRIHVENRVAGTPELHRFAMGAAERVCSCW